MAEPVIFKNRVSLAVYAVQALLPALVAVLALYLSTLLFHVPFDRNYVAFSAVVVLLCAILVRPAQVTSNEPFAVWADRVVSVFARWFVLFVILMFIGYASKSSSLFSRRVVLAWAVVTPLLLVLTIYVVNRVSTRVLADPANARRVVFAGLNDVSRALADRLQRNKGLGMVVSGFFDDRSAERTGASDTVRLLGRLPDLAPYVKQQHIDVIFIALPIRHVQRVMALVDDLRDTTASIYYAPDIYVFDLIQARTTEIGGIPVIAMCETPFSEFRGISKRIFDLCCSVALLPVLLPLMSIIALLVRLSSPGPIIFRQRRYGLDGRQITVYKFRTMTVTEDGASITQVTRNDARVTSVGRVLRRLSLDELPQLFNVLQGRMSLVGPRPHAVAHNEEYRRLIKGYMVRHKVLPGITGLAQINGCRGETAELAQMQARVNFDLDYLRRWSPLLDLKIIMTTIWQILRNPRGVY